MLWENEQEKHKVEDLEDQQARLLEEKIKLEELEKRK